MNTTFNIGDKVKTSETSFLIVTGIRHDKNGCLLIDVISKPGYHMSYYSYELVKI